METLATVLNCDDGDEILIYYGTCANRACVHCSLL